MVNSVRPVELRRLVKRRGFATVRIATLVFLATVEDAVEATDNSLFLNVISKTQTRSKIVFIPTNQVAIHLPAADRDGRFEQCRVCDAVDSSRRIEVRWQRCRGVRTCRDVERQILQIKVRLPAELFSDGREQLPAQAQIQSQFTGGFPVVLHVARIALLRRRDKVRRRNLV